MNIQVNTGLQNKNSGNVQNQADAGGDGGEGGDDENYPGGFRAGPGLIPPVLLNPALGAYPGGLTQTAAYLTEQPTQLPTMQPGFVDEIVWDTPVPTPSPRSWLMWVGGGLVVIVLVLVAIAYFFMGKDKAANSTNSNNSYKGNGLVNNLGPAPPPMNDLAPRPLANNVPNLNNQA